MANNLTGAYEAVFLVRVRQINGILATLHHSRVAPSTTPGFPHSIQLTVGSSPLIEADQLERFQRWTLQAAAASPRTAPHVMRRTLLTTSPRGVAEFYEHNWHMLDISVLEPAPAGVVYGTAEVQISTPTVSFHADTPSTVTVHAHIRARYRAAPQTRPLPEFIHGEVRARYSARAVTLPDGSVALRVQVSHQDDQIAFIPEPGSGASPQDVQAIAEEVRRALRTTFKVLDVGLPQGFAFSEFGAIGAGDAQAMVLPFQPSGAPLPPGALGSIGASFLGNAEFAVGVSKEYVDTHIADLQEQMRSIAARTRPRLESPLGTATYTVTMSPLTVQWSAGGFDIAGRVTLTSDRWWAPNGWIEFTQRFTLVLDVPTQAVSLQPVGPPAVDESFAIPHDDALGAVIQARDAALPGASAQLYLVIDGARVKLLSGLSSFDPFATVRYTDLEITPDGLILRGLIGTGGRVAPIVNVSEIDGGAAYSAFTSWVPGGRILSFRWTWVEAVHPIPWFNTTSSHVETHRFICPKMPGMERANRVCLQVIGNRINGNGFLEEAVGGDVCEVTAHEPILVVPPWAFEAIVPIWRVDPPFDAVLAEAVQAHVNVAAGTRAVDAIGPNVLVHFTGRDFEATLTRLARTLEPLPLRETCLSVFLVLPEGTFNATRREVEARLGSVPERFPAALSVTEDYGAGWSRIFGVRGDRLSAHVINARGEAVWSHEGALDDERFPRALREHLLPAPPAAHRSMRLAVRPGDSAPDAVLADLENNELALHRLRGAPVVLAFWQSWSAPSLRELRRLEEQHRQGGGPRVLAINGGEDRKTLERVRSEHGFTIPLFEDRGRALAARYGVRCWPTLVTVGSNGRIASIQLGEAHEHTAPTTKQGSPS